MTGISKLVQFCDLYPGGKIKYAQGEPLSRHTTFRIGGPAALMVMPDSEEQIAALVGFCKESEIRLFTLGKGSNILAADEGFDGAVMLLGSDFSRISRDGDRVYAQAGASMASVCKFAAEQGLSGL